MAWPATVSPGQTVASATTNSIIAALASWGGDVTANNNDLTDVDTLRSRVARMGVLGALVLGQRDAFQGRDLWGVVEGIAGLLFVQSGGYYAFEILPAGPYADNAAAIAAGLGYGRIYITADGTLKARYIP